MMTNLHAYLKIVKEIKCLLLKNSRHINIFLNLILLLVFNFTAYSTNNLKPFISSNDSIKQLNKNQNNNIYVTEGTIIIGFNNDSINHIEKQKNTNTTLIYISPKTTFFYSKTEQKNFSLVYIKDTSITLSGITIATQNPQITKSKVDRKLIITEVITQNPFQNPYSIETFYFNLVFITSKTNELSVNKQLLSFYSNNSLCYTFIEKYNSPLFFQNIKYCSLLTAAFYTRPPPFLS